MSGAVGTVVSGAVGTVVDEDLWTSKKYSQSLNFAITMFYE